MQRYHIVISFVLLGLFVPALVVFPVLYLCLGWTLVPSVLCSLLLGQLLVLTIGVLGDLAAFVVRFRSKRTRRNGILYGDSKDNEQ